jgi:hypothetical protein
LNQVDVLAMPTTPMKAHVHDPDLDLQHLGAHGGTITSNTVAREQSGRDGPLQLNFLTTYGRDIIPAFTPDSPGSVI